MALNFFNNLKQETLTQLDDYINSYDRQYNTTERKVQLDLSTMSPLQQYLKQTTKTPITSKSRSFLNASTENISFKKFINTSNVLEYSKHKALSLPKEIALKEVQKILVQCDYDIKDYLPTNVDRNFSIKIKSKEN